MKIDIDSTWGIITDHETGEKLIFMPRAPYRFQALLDKLLTNTQQNRLVEHDGTYKLSKKATKILLEEAQKQKK